MLLQEILAGTNSKIVKKTDEFWVLYSVPKIHFFPRYSNSWDADLKKFYGGDELGDDATWEQWKPIRSKIEKITKVDYADTNSHGWFLVTKGTVNFDVSRFSSSQNRRRNTPMGKEHKNSDGEVPILMGELTFRRIIDMVKVLKALVKVKPETASYKVVGDDRVRGMTVQEVIQGGAEKHDETRVFRAGALKELVMFHGTSKKRADEILKTGLRPSKRGSTYYDQIPGYSEQNVYMVSSPGAAANYATREAINDRSDAVILKVTLTPMQVMRVLPDEDTMHWFDSLPEMNKKHLLKKHPILAEIWRDKGFNVHIKNMNHAERKFGLDWLFEPDEYWRKTDKPDPFKPNAQKILQKYGYDRSNLEALEHELYTAIVNAFIDATKVQSLKKHGLAAYPGAIPAKQIKVLKTWSITGSKIKANAGRDEYNAASEKQEKTVKYTK